jgi:hypothetical protein
VELFTVSTASVLRFKFKLPGNKRRIKKNGRNIADRERCRGRTFFCSWIDVWLHCLADLKAPWPPISSSHPWSNTFVSWWPRKAENGRIFWVDRGVRNHMLQEN